MNWFKVDANEMLFSEMNMTERGALITIRSLTAFLEREPTESEILKLPGMGRKLIKSLTERLQNTNGTVTETLQNTLGSISKIKRTRKMDADRQRKMRSKDSNVTRDVTQESRKSPSVDKSRLDKIREDNKKIRDMSVSQPTLFQPTMEGFNLLWSKYPSKLGRKAAERHFFATVLSPEDFQSIKMALLNYLALLERIPDRPAQNGSTWFNNWKDFVDTESVEQIVYNSKSREPIMDVGVW